MSIRPALAALAAATFVTSPLTLAQDVRVTCTGTVQSIFTGGVGSGPFAGATVGEAVTLVFDVEAGNQLPFGEALGVLNWPSSSLTIGAAADGLGFSLGQLVNLHDDAVQYGDIVSASTVLASDESIRFQMLLFDPTGQTWSTSDWASLIGTSVQAAGLNQLFMMWSAQGSVIFDLAAVQFEAAPGGVVGMPYCSAVANSTGQVGVVSSYGLDTPASNDLTLRASQLPTQSFGYFLVSANQGFVAQAGGSDGNLCLSGAIGRFVGPGQAIVTDFGGEIVLPVDLAHLPSPTGPLSVQAGQTWNFQLWYRDTSPAGPTSNFTRGLALSFQ